MTRDISAAGARSAHAQETDEVWLPLLELSHSAWSEDVFITNNGESVTSNGQVYQPFPFNITLPDEVKDGLPLMRWVADNTSLELMSQLRAVASQSGYIGARCAWIRAADPDTLEVPFLTMDLRAVEYNSSQISGELTVEPRLEGAFGIKKFTPETAPALF